VPFIAFPNRHFSLCKPSGSGEGWNPTNNKLAHSHTTDVMVINSFFTTMLPTTSRLHCIDSAHAFEALLHSPVDKQKCLPLS